MRFDSSLSGRENTSRIVEMKTEFEFDRMKKVVLRSVLDFNLFSARIIAGC